MMHVLLQLAQTSSPEKASMASRVIWATIIAVPPLVIAGTVLVYLRKKTLDQQTESNAAASLMEQLREMHRRGEISDAEYEQTRKSMASRLSQVMDTKRAGGLFELPEPKRRVSRREMGPIAPPKDAVPPGGIGPGAAPAEHPGKRSVEGLDDAPPGYGAGGGSAKPQTPSP
ncbi:MAG TPA: SHOCT domain-containing protein [Phycisphaerales bacterium]|jgi:hypothetical protein|nr:SHOCT domain-containing protein [Phycisphaerales bacterium]